MKQLIKIAMAAVLLASCSNSEIPRGWVGNYFSADGSWQCSLFEDVALYQNDVWQYQSVTKKDTTLSVTIINGSKTVNLDFAGRYIAFQNELKENGKVVAITRERPQLVDAKYSVNGELLGHVCRNYVGQALSWAPHCDSVCGIEPQKRIEPEIETPDGTIGEAVVRLYLHNSFRGIRSVERIGLFLNDDCRIVYDNRLETAKRKMEVVRKDKHGKMFEVKIPVDGVADFHFEREFLESGYEDLLKFYFSGALDYMVKQGDTVLVVVEQSKSNWYNGGNLYRGLSPFGKVIVSPRTDSLKTEEDYLAAAQLFTDSVMNVFANVDCAAFSPYKAQLRNHLAYYTGRVMMTFFIHRKLQNGETVSDEFVEKLKSQCPIDDAAILKTSESVKYAIEYIELFSGKAKYEPSGATSFDVKLPEDAIKLGFSPKVADLLATRALLQKMRFSRNGFRGGLVTDDEFYSQLAKIKSPDYRNCLETRYKDFAEVRSYVSRAKNERNLTDADFENFKNLTDTTMSLILRDIQAGRTKIDAQPPFYEYFYDISTFLAPNIYSFPYAYLIDKDNNNAVIDSAYSSVAYFIFDNLTPGKKYAVAYCGDTAQFRPSDENYVGFSYKPGHSGKASKLVMQY